MTFRAGAQAGGHDRGPDLDTSLGHQSRRGVPDLLRRGRPLVLQGAASTLADRLGAALAERADATGDSGQLRAALDDIRVGAVANSAGTIHRAKRLDEHRAMTA